MAPRPGLGTRLLSVGPLALVWACAAWPIVLWLLHGRDPELAVVVAQHTRSGVWVATWSLGLAGIVACLVFPPALAFVRRGTARVWTSITMDQAPLVKALAELRHFETASRHAEVGRLFRLRRQHGQALLHFARAVELDPTIASAWHQFGLVLFAQHECQAAATAFANAEQLDPGHAFGDALLHHGRARFLLGDSGALSLLREHARRHGGGPRSQLWLADALAATGDHDGARAALRAAAAPPRTRLSAEDNWFRALARVRLWGKGGSA